MVFFTLFCNLINPLIAQQTTNYWNILAQVKIEQKQHATKGYSVDLPTFSLALQQLNGKTITLQGYMIPLQELRSQNQFVFSRYPFSLCYFCGAAGIETVIEVKSLQPIPFTEDRIALRGVLRLNPDNPNNLLYILEQAKVVE